MKVNSDFDEASIVARNKSEDTMKSTGWEMTD